LAWTTFRCGNDEDAAIGINSARCVAVNDKAGAVITGTTTLCRIISQTAPDTPTTPGTYFTDGPLGTNVPTDADLRHHLLHVSERDARCDRRQDILMCAGVTADAAWPGATGS